CVRALPDLEQSLERVLDVARLQLFPIRELDSLADGEGVGLAAVRRLRDLGREVGHDLRSLGTAGALEADEPVVAQDQQLPLLERVVDLRIGGPRRRRLRDGVERAARGAARRRRRGALLATPAARGEDEA